MSLDQYFVQDKRKFYFFKYVVLMFPFFNLAARSQFFYFFNDQLSKVFLLEPFNTIPIKVLCCLLHACGACVIHT